MSDQIPESAEEIKQDPDVQRALQKATPSEDAKPVAKTRDKLLVGTHILLLVVLGVCRYVIQQPFLRLEDDSIRLGHKLIYAIASAIGLLITLRLLDVYLISRVANPVQKYNLTRVLRLTAWILIVFIAITILFQNWYTAVVSFGLISLILGFALQTPVTSFIGWIYILVREPYRVGDRIKIGTATGDVIDVSYLDTTLWEFGGDVLSTDHPTGRVIKFPNSSVLSTPVYNYTWPLFPYIWNEIKFHIAYDSDLEFVAATMQEIAEKEVGEGMMKQVRVFRDLLAQTPVDQLQVQERPVVMFRVSENTWLEAIVRYLVHPKEAGRVKTRLIKDLLTKLNSEPDRVLFPRGNAR
jgi:small-conductance mechanosensitive channel